jgi:hypothetical protein
MTGHIMARGGREARIVLASANCLFLELRSACHVA